MEEQGDDTSDSRFMETDDPYHDETRDIEDWPGGRSYCLKIDSFDDKNIFEIYFQARDESCRIGLNVEQRFSPDGAYSLVVTKLEPGGVAMSARVQKGDVLVRPAGPVFRDASLPLQDPDRCRL